ncbi:MAG: ketopantoate reductase family protein [Burkholderiaceae bacterium]
MINAMTSKSIVIVGAGAIGASVAADLVRAEHDVTLVDQWTDHVQMINKCGLKVSVDGQKFTVKVTALHPSDLTVGARQFDIGIIAVKAYDTRWTTELILPHLKPGGYVVGMQNALCDEDIARSIDSARIVSNVIELSAEVFCPGEVVRNTSHVKTWFGVGIDKDAVDSFSGERVEEVASLLKNVGRVAILDDVTAAKWTKLISNSMMLGPLGITGLRLGEALGINGLQEFLVKVGSEAIAVAAARGFSVQPVFGLTYEELQGSPAKISRTLVDTLVKHIGPNAMVAPAQDYKKGRQTEVAAINGLIALSGAHFGIATPANKAIVDLDRLIRGGELSPAAENIELAARMAGV